MLDLLKLHKSPPVRRISAFCGYARDLDPQQLRDAYHDLVRMAPRRRQKGRPYLVRREGVPSTGVRTNRREEHLAIALYNARKQSEEYYLPGGRRLSLIHYQTPLQATRADKGVGKVDLLAVLEPEDLCVIELKVSGKGGRPSETPLKALLEGLAYCAIVEANLDTIAAEGAAAGVTLASRRPSLIVLAPDKYWLAYLRHKRAGDWRSSLEGLIAGLYKSIGIEAHLLALQDVAWEVGLDGKAPLLTRQGRLVGLDALQA